MLNWSEYEEEEIADRWRTILPLTVWAVVIGLILGMVLYTSKCMADPLFSATAEGATITLTDEPCTLKAIGNLPYRATWVEKDKTYEGCWGARPDIGFVLAYFDDLSVALIPMQAFRKVSRV